MRVYAIFTVFLIAVVGLMYVGLSKLDAEAPRIAVEEPKENMRYTAVDREVTIHIRAMIRDDRAIKSIHIELWGITIDGAFANAKTLLSKSFNSTDVKEYLVNRVIAANLDGFVLPGHYYVRFVVEDFIGNKRIIWIKIYVATNNTHEASNRLKHHNTPQVWLEDSTPAFPYICRVRVEA